MFVFVALTLNAITSLVGALVGLFSRACIGGQITQDCRAGQEEAMLQRANRRGRTVLHRQVCSQLHHPRAWRKGFSGAPKAVLNCSSWIAGSPYYLMITLAGLWLLPRPRAPSLVQGSGSSSLKSRGSPEASLLPCSRSLAPRRLCSTEHARASSAPARLLTDASLRAA